MASGKVTAISTNNSKVMLIEDFNYFVPLSMVRNLI
jgi:cell shape-determining protein MreC